MPRGLVEDDPLIDALFDNEKTAVRFSDRGDGNFGGAYGQPLDYSLSRVGLRGGLDRLR